jgi:ribosome biogenesis GTPase A
MAKAKRELEALIKSVDVVAEVLDSRIPESSSNPDIEKITGKLPRIKILNKSDIADPESTKLWASCFEKRGYGTLVTDSSTGAGCEKLAVLVRSMLKEKTQRYLQKGIVNMPLKVMVLGIPNTGKSSLINRISGKKTLKTEDRPGVTRQNHWVRLESGIELLDTPGILWPRLDNEECALKLAFTGAIKDQIMDVETLGFKLCEALAKKYQKNLKERYNLGDIEGLETIEIYEQICKKRGYLISGGEFDYFRCANALLDDFRSAKLGRITLELPEG